MAAAEDLKSSVRKDVQVRVLPPLPSPLVPRPADLKPDQFAAYGDLLGRLHVSLHQRQRHVIQRVAVAIGALRPGRPVGLRRRGPVVIVNAYSNAWPVLFPQHGPGRKHLRPIIHEPWQKSIVERCPNGCRHWRIVRGRNYPAHSFTNHSEDILRLFLWACERVGLHPRRASRVVASIARRADVARLDVLFSDDRASDIPALAIN